MKDNATIPDKFIAPRRYPCSECHHGLCQFDDRGYINQYIKIGKSIEAVITLDGVAKFIMLADKDNEDTSDRQC